MLKQVANGDLYKVYCHIRRLLQHQPHEYEAKSATELTRLNHHLNRPFLAPLIGRVSVYALNKFANELARSGERNFSSTCTGTFTKTMGLPCAHELQRRYIANQPVYLSLVHSHWYLLPANLAHHNGLQQPQLLGPIRTTEGSGDDDDHSAVETASSAETEVGRSDLDDETVESDIGDMREAADLLTLMSSSSPKLHRENLEDAQPDGVQVFLKLLARGFVVGRHDAGPEMAARSSIYHLFCLFWSWRLVTFCCLLLSQLDVMRGFFSPEGVRYHVRLVDLRLYFFPFMIVIELL